MIKTSSSEEDDPPIGYFQLVGNPWPNVCVLPDDIKHPTLSIFMEGGKPAFHLNMNRMGWVGEYIRIPIDLYKVTMLSILIEEVVNQLMVNKVSIMMIGSNRHWPESNGLTDSNLELKVTIGKNSQGIFYITFHPKEMPWVIFEFMPDYAMELIDKDGNAISDEVISNICIRGWIKTLMQLIN